jgi:hypothetical protein
MLLYQFTNSWYIPITVQARFRCPYIVFYSQRIHVALIVYAHVVKNDNAIHNILEVFLTSESCGTLADGILCLEDTKGPFNIFSIFMMLASKQFLLTCLRPTDISD